MELSAVALVLLIAQCNSAVADAALVTAIMYLPYGSRASEKRSLIQSYYPTLETPYYRMAAPDGSLPRAASATAELHWAIKRTSATALSSMREPQNQRCG